eukprot:Nitzschia sp. Nitz4//scaffold103_size77763//2583//4601//NITZ4_005434-RA/size77763-processed-gene-0.0-mRNA-1//1//CDS//3329532295//2727//frame0
MTMPSEPTNTENPPVVGGDQEPTPTPTPETASGLANGDATATATTANGETNKESPETETPPSSTNKEGGADSEGNLPVFEFLSGMKRDLQARVPLYANDWKRPENVFTVLNAILFAFVVQLIPALIFAELLDRQTEGSLAVAEVLLSAGIIGIIYALISGQPLVLLGITGPVAILLGTSYGLAEQFDAEYFSFFWWLCMWTALLHILTAMVGLVNFVWQITPFSSQIFEFFIAMSFIYESVRDLVEPIHLGKSLGEADLHERSAGYASLVIGLLTFVICWTLHFAETWVYLTRQVRSFLSSYNMMIAIIIMTALSYLPGVDQKEGDAHGLERVNIRFTPWDWQPTADRPWITSPMEGIDAKGIFGALFPAFMLYLLFFIDHNISSILTQSPKYNLTKPPAYHWDFFCLGITIIPCGLLGLPPGSGLIPQAPLHTRALCAKKYEMIHGVKREVFTSCEEQRWSALFQATLMFVALSAIVVISWIPVGCLFGVFLYLGVGAMHGNEVWERITLMFMLPKKRPQIPVVAKVSSWNVTRAYTAVQVSCAVLVFGIAQFAEVGYIFPALIALLVPLRSYGVSRMFSAEDLKHLDPVDESEEDYEEEQKQIHAAERRSSMGEEDIFHGFSSFRTKGVDHDAAGYYKHHPDNLPRSPTGETGLRQRHIVHSEDLESIEC